jgi:hypothetical protein
MGGGFFWLKIWAPPAVTGFVMNIEGDRTAVCKVETYCLQKKYISLREGGTTKALRCKCENLWGTPLRKKTDRFTIFVF